MQIIKLANQVLAFLLEVGMFIAIGYWGFLQGKTNGVKYTLALVLPLVAMTLWGLFAAPNAAYRLEFPIRLIFEMVLFVLAAFLIYKTGHTTWAIGFGLMAFVSELIAYIYKQ